MKERPILFSGPMIRAILDGRKTITRRVVKPQPCAEFLSRGVVCVVPQWPLQDGVRWFMADGCSELRPCPYGGPGDRLWVRETWQRIEPRNSGPARVMYAATHIGDVPADGWRPSIHMPRWASRLTLEVTGVRCERLQEIGRDGRIAADVKAEGISQRAIKDWRKWLHQDDAPAHTFSVLWDSINGKRDDGQFAWDNNPWVWVVAFKRV